MKKLILIFFLLFFSFNAWSVNLDILTQQAQSGDSESANELGLLYLYGEDVERDAIKGRQLLQQAAEKGDAEAQYSLGLMYVEENSAKSDKELAIKWLTKAAEQDNIEAQFRLAKIHATIPGIENTKLAEKWYLRAAENGLAEAQYELGFRYLTILTPDLLDGRGNGLHSNAFKWLLKAAEQGNENAYYWLGELYFKGQGIARDYDEAYKWWTKAATVKGGFMAQSKLDKFYINGKPVRMVQALEQQAEAGDLAAIAEMVDIYWLNEEVWYDQAALIKWIIALGDAADSRDQSYVGHSYQYGINGLEQNNAKAVKWYTKSASKGYDESVIILSNAWLVGDLGLNSDHTKAVELLRKQAMNGSPQAQMHLAGLYIEGFGVLQNYEQAIGLYTKVAENADGYYQREAQSILGDLYAAGIGIKQNYMEALKWNQLAASNGNSEELYNLAEMYANGLGTEQNYVEAIRLYEEAKFSDKAKIALQRIYYLGEVTPPDYTRAFQLAQELSDKDVPFGYYALSLAFYEGKGVEQDNATALFWLQKVFYACNATFSDLDKSRTLAFKLNQTATHIEKQITGWQPENLPNYKDGKAFDYEEILENAQNNAVEAQFELGKRYFEGAGLKQDYLQAIEWLTKAAENGSAEAQYALAEIYQQGKGIKVNNERALKWYTAAAEKGNAKAQYKLGRLLLFGGHGLTKDQEKAFEWILKAADQDLPDAQLDLGIMYRHGRGTEQNLVHSVLWMLEAYNNSKPLCEYNEFTLESMLDDTIQHIKDSDWEEFYNLLVIKELLIPNYFISIN